MALAAKKTIPSGAAIVVTTAAPSEFLMIQRGGNRSLPHPQASQTTTTPIPTPSAAAPARQRRRNSIGRRSVRRFVPPTSGRSRDAQPGQVTDVSWPARVRFHSSEQVLWAVKIDQLSRVLQILCLRISRKN